MPVLETIAAAVSRKRGRFIVAALKSLQESGTGRWKIKEIQYALDWLEPQSATDLVGGLRASEILRYDNLATDLMDPQLLDTAGHRLELGAWDRREL